MNLSHLRKKVRIKAHAYLGRVIIKCRIIDRNSLAQEAIIDDKERLEVLSLDALVTCCIW